MIQRILTLGLAALALTALPLAAGGIDVSVELQVTYVDPEITAIEVGDVYTLRITVDDSVADTNASTVNGVFPGLVTSWALLADAGNAGTWNPIGMVDLPGGNYVTNANGDNITLEILGSGFPDGAAGWPFSFFDHYVDWVPNDISDSGAGETFAEQLGIPFGVPPGELGLNITFASDDRGETFRVAELRIADPSVLDVPTSSTAGALLLVGLLALVAVRRLA